MASRGFAESGESARSMDLLHDWKRRPCVPGKHGGMRAAVFVMGLQAMEIMAIAAVGNNLITYIFNDMHYSLPKSANIVTNFVGTIFLLSVVGGYLSDSYLGSFPTMLIFGFVELIGYILMAVQAHFSALKPRLCAMPRESERCETPRGIQTFFLYTGLYLAALGSGCLKPNMIAHGADQFEGENPSDGRISTYFNFAYLSFCIGELVALTLLIWVQTHAGVDVGFAISAGIMFMGLLSLVLGTPCYRNRIPQGSVFTRILQVFVAAFRNRKLHAPPITHEAKQIAHSNQFRCLDKATIGGESRETNSKWRRCSAQQVEEVKVIIRMMPIFGCTIIMNCVLAQLQTFSVEQGSAMNNVIGHASTVFSVPPASMQAIPYVILIFAVPLYDAILVPLLRRLTGVQTGITQLQRIGIGLFISTLSMLTAALVERRRLARAAAGHRLSILWLAPQYVVFGVSEMFTAVGLIEFFYRRAPVGTQSMLTALTYCSYSMGFFLSGVLVSAVNRVTSAHGARGWLASNDLNRDWLDRFYWLLACLSLANLFQYLYWSVWFRRSSPVVQASTDPPNM